MCIYMSDRSANCEHSECQIIKTIRKMNKPIFKTQLKSRRHHANHSSNSNSDSESEGALRDMM